MAELKQQEFGVKEDFQAITPHKAPDFRAEQIKAGINLAVGLGRAESASQGREAALELSGSDLSLEEVNKNVDLFEQYEDVTVQRESEGGPVSKRRLDEIRDTALTKANLTSRGLQEAINRGSISHLEATARANMNVKRLSNSLVGSLFQNEFRNAFSGVTGNPAGSPAMTLNKSPAEIQEESTRKAVVESNALRAKQINDYSLKFGMPPEEAENRLDALAVQEQKIAQAEAMDKSNLRTDEMKVRESTREFDVAVAPLMGDITVAFSSGRGIDPTEVASLRANVRQVKQAITSNHLKKGMGSGAYKNLTAFADRWEKEQIDYITAISEQSLSKEQAELMSNSMKKVMANELPLVYAISQFNPTLAQSLGLMDEESRLELVERLGIDIDKITNLADEFRDAGDTINPNVNSSPEQAKSLAPIMAGNSGGANKEIVSEYVEQGGDVEDLNVAWMASPAESLKTISKSLFGPIEDGDSTSIKTGVNILNKTADKFSRLVQDYNLGEGEYSVSFRRPTGFQGQDIHSLVIHMPSGVPKAEKEILRQSYKALAKTPSLWEDEFESAAKAFEAMHNEGFRFDVKALGGEKGLSRDDFEETGRGLIRKTAKPKKQSSVSDGSPPLRPGILKIADELAKSQSAITVSVDRTEAVKEKDFEAKVPKGKEPPLSVKNNNPGNIETGPDNWQGATGDDGRFITFESPKMGMRAMARDLHTKISRGLDTISKILNTYAPPEDNDTEAYIRNVVKATGIESDEVITIDDRDTLMKAMTEVEAGFQPWSDALIDEGIRLADGE